MVWFGSTPTPCYLPHLTLASPLSTPPCLYTILLCVLFTTCLMKNENPDNVSSNLFLTLDWFPVQFSLTYQQLWQRFLGDTAGKCFRNCISMNVKDNIKENRVESQPGSADYGRHKLALAPWSLICGQWPCHRQSTLG